MTPELLRAATGCTAERAALFADPLSAACAFYGIDTPARLAAFLAQIGHESGSLRFTTELWGPTPAQARYEGRKDLGNTQPGDGERFKGHGLIQTTGRYNHARVRDRLRERFPHLDVPDFEADPERLAEPQWACLSAADYWDDKGLNAQADAGMFEQITRRINGGLNGQADRLARWKRAQEALGAPPATLPSPAPENPATARPGAAVATLETTMPLPAILAAVLPSIISAIPQLGKLFGSGSEVAERNVKAAEIAIGIVKDATGARNAQEAAEVIATDPAMAQVARQAVEARWYELTESGGGGIEGARKFNTANMALGVNGLRSPAFIISLVLMVFPLLLAVDLFFVHPDQYQSELRTQIVTGLLLTISMVGAFWLGSSFGSARKDEQRL